MRDNLRWPRALVWAVAAAGITSCGSTRPRTDSTTSPSFESELSGVVRLANDCSGVLVRPDVVLSAAHCFVNDHVLPDVFVRRHRYAIASCAVHPGAFSSPRRDCLGQDSQLNVAHDLAVLRLREPVDRAEASPLPVLLDFEPEDQWEGRSIFLAGWSRFPAWIGAARLDSGWNVAQSLRGGVLRTAPASDDETAFGSRFGNSGGPALVAIRNEPWVAGVLSSSSSAQGLDSMFAATFDPDNAAWLREHLDY